MPCEIMEAVRGVIRDEIRRDDPIGPDTDLVADLELDSLALLNVVVALENRFEVCIEPEPGETLSRVGDVVDFLIERQEGAA